MLHNKRGILCPDVIDQNCYSIRIETFFKKTFRILVQTIIFPLTVNTPLVLTTAGENGGMK